jgi:hypothetical protein
VRYLPILFLFFTACGPTKQIIANFQKDQERQERQDRQYVVAYRKGCKYKIPGRFEIIDKSSGYYGCKGTIEGYPWLLDTVVWNYYFYTFYCKGYQPRMDIFFKESQLKRLGNLVK